MKRRIFIKKGAAFIGMGLLGASMVRCSKGNDDDPVNPDKPVDNHPVITPNAGMDLYGSILDNEDNPVAGVVVSDGYSCTVTDSKGIYQMKRDAKALVVFYSVPEQYEVNKFGSNVSAASFFQTLEVAKSRYNFDLLKLSEVENDFNLIAIGDPQVKNDDNISRYTAETVADMTATISALGGPCYGIVLGDTVHDQPGLFAKMRNATGATGMPYFTTIGNHDKTGGNDTTPRNVNVYTSVLGPVNYSWNRGRVHFISLDNCLYSSASSYACGLEDYQIEWLKQDLSYVDKDKMIIVYYHIQLRNASFPNRAAFFDVLKDYSNLHLMCGHTHYAQNYQITTPRSVFEHIHGATCGAWWNSTINTDGTPNGYGVYEIRGTELKNWYYKSVKYPKSMQIRLHRGNTQFGGSYGRFDYGRGENIVANIWNADSQWKIEAYEDGVYAGELTRLSSGSFMIDAFAAGYHVGVLNKNPDSFRGMAGRGSNDHLWMHTLKNPQANSIEVRATDRFGVTYSSSEIIRELTAAEKYS